MAAAIDPGAAESGEAEHGRETAAHRHVFPVILTACGFPFRYEWKKMLA